MMFKIFFHVIDQKGIYQCNVTKQMDLKFLHASQKHLHKLYENVLENEY